jgi:hypothetical protein
MAVIPCDWHGCLAGVACVGQAWRNKRPAWRDLDEARAGRYRAAVAIDADLAAAALAATWQHLARALPGAWVRRDGGAFAWVSGVALPALNGVWAESADPHPAPLPGCLTACKPPACRTACSCGPEPARRWPGWPPPAR